MGVTLLVAITVVGATGIVLFGTISLGDARTQSDIDAAEQAMTQLDSHFSLVALGSSTRQRSTVSLRSGASLSVDGDSGTMNVSVVNRSDGSLEFVVLDTTLGAIVYENHGTTLAYQGGGVWKRTATGRSTMISPPEFHYRTRSGYDPTLTLPIVVVDGDGSIAEVAVVESAGTIPKFPLDAPGRKNPLERGEVTITVQSAYYLAWGEFFETRTDGAVLYDHPGQRVSVTLGVRPGAPGVAGGLVSGATGSALTFEDQAEADSYNSSLGDYSSTNAARTSIVAAGPVELHNHATLYGDLVAGGSVTLQNKAAITGNVSHAGSLTNDGTIGGWTRNRAPIDVPNPVGWLIDEKVEAFESSNDNAGAPIDPASDTLTGCTPSCTLPAGDYVLQNVSLGTNEELVLDASGGKVVEVAVRDGVTLGSGSEIRVVGDGTAKFYVEDDLTIVSDGNVSVPGQRAPGMWFYMNPGSAATVQDQGRFVGVIYGPGGGAHPGVDVTIEDQATVYGGAVGAVASVPNGIGIHFDEALLGVDPLAGTGGEEPPITYMHVTENRINVSSG